METMTAPGVRVVLVVLVVLAGLALALTPTPALALALPLALAPALVLALVVVFPALVARVALAVRTIQTPQTVCPAANPRPTAAPSVARCSTHQTRKNRSQMTAQE